MLDSITCVAGVQNVLIYSKRSSTRKEVWDIFCGSSILSDFVAQGAFRILNFDINTTVVYYDFYRAKYEYFN